MSTFHKWGIYGGMSIILVFITVSVTMTNARISRLDTKYNSEYSKIIALELKGHSLLNQLIDQKKDVRRTGK
jgi:hypothetical protein